MHRAKICSSWSVLDFLERFSISCVIRRKLRAKTYLMIQKYECEWSCHYLQFHMSHYSRNEELNLRPRFDQAQGLEPSGHPLMLQTTVAGSGSGTNRKPELYSWLFQRVTALHRRCSVKKISESVWLIGLSTSNEPTHLKWSTYLSTSFYRRQDENSIPQIIWSQIRKRVLFFIFLRQFRF